VSLQQPSKTAVLKRRTKSNKLVTNKKQIQSFIPTTDISLYWKANRINYSNKLINMTFQEMQKNKIKSQLKTGNKANIDIKLSQLILLKKKTIRTRAHTHTHTHTHIYIYMHITTNSSAAFFHTYKTKIFGII
jgi:hypothetical protein